MPSIVDRVLALFAIILLSPLYLIAFVGVKLSSPGSFLYSARRVGLNGKQFCMYKIRTMHVQQTDIERQKITASNDSRVFTFGQFLRMTKIDELPQFFNILRGEMAIIGPRPEDPDIVKDHYKSWHWDTLTVKPGLASPGSLYNYTHFKIYVSDQNIERNYVDNFLDRKLGLDAIYALNKSTVYDVQIIMRTIAQIILTIIGVEKLKSPPEVDEAALKYNITYAHRNKRNEGNEP